MSADPSDSLIAKAIQLSLPLFFRESEQENEIVWSDMDITDLRETLLLDALKTIAGARERRRLSLREQAWEWVCEIGNGPFSFTACAREVGLNPDELRVGLARMIEVSVEATVFDIQNARAVLRHYHEEPAARVAANIDIGALVKAQKA